MKTRTTTISLDAETFARIEQVTELSGGSVASFAARWARKMANLTPNQMAAVADLVKRFEAENEQRGN